MMAGFDSSLVDLNKVDVYNCVDGTFAEASYTLTQTLLRYRAGVGLDKCASLSSPPSTPNSDLISL